MRPKPTWEQALAQGRPRLALFRWLMDRYGTHWKLWLPTETLGARIAADAGRFAAKHGIPPETLRGVAERTAPLILDIIVHLGHVHFRRPYRVWRRNRAEWEVTMSEAVRTLELERLKRQVGSRITNDRQAREALDRKQNVLALRDLDYSVSEIVQETGLGRTTVYRFLAEEGGRTPGGGRSPNRYKKDHV